MPTYALSACDGFARPRADNLTERALRKFTSGIGARLCILASDILRRSSSHASTSPWSQATHLPDR